MRTYGAFAPGFSLINDDSLESIRSPSLIARPKLRWRRISADQVEGSPNAMFIFFATFLSLINLRLIMRIAGLSRKPLSSNGRLGRDLAD